MRVALVGNRFLVGSFYVVSLRAPKYFFFFNLGLEVSKRALVWPKDLKAGVHGLFRSSCWLFA